MVHLKAKFGNRNKELQRKQYAVVLHRKSGSPHQEERPRSRRVQHTVNAFLISCLIPALQRVGVQDVLRNRLIPKDTILGTEPQSAAEDGRIYSGEFLTVELYLTITCVVKTAESIEQADFPLPLSPTTATILQGKLSGGIPRDTLSTSCW